MKLFLDSANLQEIEECLQLGFISGITTNPSLMSKEPKGDFDKHIQKIVDLVCRHPKCSHLSVEVFAKESDEMIAQACGMVDRFSRGAFKITVKIPIGWKELGVVTALTNAGISVNVTCCFTEAQCILAANAGAKYVSIFAGRLMDVNGDPFFVVNHVRDVFDRRLYQEDHTKCEIIVGSVRTTHEIPQYHSHGAHIVTASYKLLKQMAHHPQTDKSVEGFLKDFKGWMEPKHFSDLKPGEKIETCPVPGCILVAKHAGRCIGSSTHFSETLGDA